jgi:hypothetical protein
MPQAPAADKWEQYAEPTAAGDKWAQYAEPVAASPDPVTLNQKRGGSSGIMPLPNMFEQIGEAAAPLARAAYSTTAPGIAEGLISRHYPEAVKKVEDTLHVPEDLRGIDPVRESVPNAVMGMVPEAAEGLEEGRVATPRGRTVPEPPKVDTLPPEQTEAIDKANRTYKDAKSQVEKREGLEAASKSMVQKTYENLHATHDAARGALDQQWGAFRQGMEGAELDPIEAFNNIEAAKAKYLKGSPASLTVFNNLVHEMGIQEFMGGEGKGEPIKPVAGSGALPFDTARVHYSAIGDKLAQGNLPGNVYQALKAVQEGLDKQLTGAAESRKLGDVYTKLKANEHQFRSDWVDPKSPLARAYKSLSPAFLEQHVLNPAKGEYISSQLKRYTEHGAQPHLPLAAKRFASEAAAITKKVPEVKELPKVKESTAKGGIGRAAARLTGKIVGGTVGSKVGHPLLGYGAGGEAGSALYDRVTKRRPTVPPPPE